MARSPVCGAFYAYADGVFVVQASESVQLNYGFVIIEISFEYTGFSKTSPNKSNNGFCVN